MKNMFTIMMVFAFNVYGIAQNTVFQNQEGQLIERIISVTDAEYGRFELVATYNGLGVFSIIIRKEHNSKITEKNVSLPALSSQNIHDFIVDEQGDLYLLYSNSTDDINLLKFNNDISTQWHIKIGNSFEESFGNVNYYKHKLLIWDDNHIVISLSFFNNQTVLKVNNSGQITWRNIYTGEDTQKCPGFDIQRINNGAILSLKDGNKASIYRINDNGDLVWSRAIDDGLYRHPRHIFIRYNLIYNFGRLTNLNLGTSCAYLIVLDLDGNIISNKTFDVLSEYSSSQIFANYKNTFYLILSTFEGNSTTLKIFQLDGQNNLLPPRVINNYFADYFSPFSELDRSSGEMFIHNNFDNESGHLLLTSFNISSLSSNVCFEQGTDQGMIMGSSTGIANHTISWGNIVKTSMPYKTVTLPNPAVSNSNIISKSEACNSAELNIDLLNTTSLVLYPNPTKDILLIRSDVEIQEIKILDVQGREIENFAQPSGSISVSHIAQGLYFAQVLKADGRTELIQIQILN